MVELPDLALLLDEPAVRRVQELPRELQPELQVVTIQIIDYIKKYRIEITFTG